LINDGRYRVGPKVIAVTGLGIRRAILGLAPTSKAMNRHR